MNLLPFGGPQDLPGRDPCHVREVRLRLSFYFCTYVEIQSPLEKYCCELLLYRYILEANAFAVGDGIAKFCYGRLPNRALTLVDVPAQQASEETINTFAPCSFVLKMSGHMV